MSNFELKNELSLFGEVVFTYTRAQAIADGVLMDVTEMAREAGFRSPVALTVGAWEACVAWSDNDNETQIYQDEAGRLWDVLVMALYGIRRTGGTTQHELPYPLLCVPRDGQSMQPVETTLKMMVSTGDDGLPALTIALPHED